MSNLLNPETIQAYLESRMDHYMDVLQQMVGINSFTRNPAGINALGILTASFFVPLGFNAQQIQSTNPEFGNHLVLTRMGSSPKTIGLITHLDTVFPAEDEAANDFVWREIGDRIYGPGTVDIKGGTVTIYMIMDMLYHLAPEWLDKVSWKIFANASEETIAWDFGEIVKEELGAQGVCCLVFEGGKRDNGRFDLVVARKGMAIYKIIVSGKASHAGSAHEQGANAIVEIARVVDKVASFTDYGNQLTFNVGVINGGTVTNRVPHYAEAKVEMRTFDTSIFDHGVKKMLDLNEHSTISSSDGYGTRVMVDMFHQTEPWPKNEKTETLYQIWAQAGAEVNIDVGREERGGLSDGNMLWHIYPTLDGLGPSGGNAHCSERSEDGSKDQEFTYRSSFVPKTVLNTAAIIKLIEGLQ